MAEFTTISELGRGGFGIVHQVADENGKTFAKKTYQVNQNFTVTESIDAHLKKRFEREANLQSGFRHKNIVPIERKFLQDSPPHFLMPLATSSLEKDIQADRHLGGNFLNAVSDIIAGLEELHSVKIYHRDLKPANVLRFGNAGDANSYYAISDFGLVALKQTQVSQLTTVGMKRVQLFCATPSCRQSVIEMQ